MRGEITDVPRFYITSFKRFSAHSSQLHDGRELVGFFGAIKYLYTGGDRKREGRSISIPPASAREFDIREVKHDVYGKRQK